VFIALGGIQIASTALIVAYAARYKGTPCPVHLPRQPRASTQPWGRVPQETSRGSSRPGGRSIAASAAPAGHGGALRASSLSCTCIPIRSTLGLAGNRMSGSSAVGRSHGSPLRCLVPTLPGRARAGRAPNFKRRARGGRDDCISWRCHRCA
jgi:hypothetical protein